MLITLVSHTDPQQPRRRFEIRRGFDRLGAIMCHYQADETNWSLPSWWEAVDHESWLGLLAAIRTESAPDHSVRAWLPVAAGEVEGWTAQPAFAWLDADTRLIDSPLPFAVRYPEETDQIALGRLIHATQAQTLVGAATTIGSTFDLVFEVFGQRWGPLLEAASWVAEAGGQMIGAALVTLYGDTPLIITLAAPGLVVADELLLTVVDSLASLRYPTARLLLAPESIWQPGAERIGFRQVAAVRQMVLQR